MPKDGSEMGVYRYMLRYQTLVGEPPTMRQIQESIPELNYRSSVRHALMALHDLGYVEQVRPPGMGRRWKAVR